MFTPGTEEKVEHHTRSSARGLSAHRWRPPWQRAISRPVSAVRGQLRKFLRFCEAVNITGSIFSMREKPTAVTERISQVRVDSSGSRPASSNAGRKRWAKGPVVAQSCVVSAPCPLGAVFLVAHVVGNKPRRYLLFQHFDNEERPSGCLRTPLVAGRDFSRRCCAH